MKLAIFGDSFADPLHGSDLVNHPSYINLLDAQSYGSSGSSLIYSYLQFVDNHKNYDRIIFFASSPSRRYHPQYDLNFFKHVMPGHTTFHDYPSDTEIRREITNAIKMYYKYLQNDEVDATIQYIILEQIKQLRNDVLIYPCFNDSMPGNEFSLVDIFLKENNSWMISNHNELKKIRKSHVDLRKNHITEENHVLLYKHLKHDIEFQRRPLSETAWHQPDPVEFVRYFSIK